MTNIVLKQFIAADATMPREVALPVPADRQAAKELVIRREFPVLDVIDALEPLSQYGLTEQDKRGVDTKIEKGGENQLNDTIIAPIARIEAK